MDEETHRRILGLEAALVAVEAERDAARKMLAEYVRVDTGRLLSRTASPRGGGSQHDEDRVLAELLPGSTGVYIDIGAAEPRESSNTWRFYERGWRGLLVEPLPAFWYGLLRERPHDALCPMAASDRVGYATLRVQGTVSSLRPDWDIAEQGRIIVETDTVFGMAIRHEMLGQRVDLMSVDVEGHEAEVLAGAHLGEVGGLLPRVLVVEDNVYHPDRKGEPTRATWEPMLLKAGYRLHWVGELNRIYAHG